MGVELALRVPARNSAELPQPLQKKPPVAPAPKPPKPVDQMEPTKPEAKPDPGAALTLTVSPGDVRTSAIIQYFFEHGKTVSVVETPGTKTPILSADVMAFVPIALTGRAQLESGTGELVLALAARGTMSVSPLPLYVREAVASNMRKPAGPLPKGPGLESLFVFHASQALPSAFDQTAGAIGNLGEGFQRIAKGGAGGGQQLFSGLIQFPFTLPALALGAVETGASFLTENLEVLHQNTNGVGKFFATLLLGLTYLLLAPLRIVTKLVSMLVVRPLALIGSALGQAIGGAEFQRISINIGPNGLLNPTESPFALERGNSNYELADPEIWLAYYAKNAGMLYGSPSPLLLELQDLRERDRTAYNALRTQLADAQIQCFYRFPSLAILRETLANRTPSPNDKRPVALIVAGPSDYNGAFLTLSTTLSQLSKGYRLIYVDCNDDVEAAQAIDKYGQPTPLSALIIAGHGSPEMANLSWADPLLGQSLDIDDVSILAPLRNRLAQKAHVVLESCETGEDKDDSTSLVEMLHSVWPQVSLHAPEISSRGAGYSLDARGMIVRTATVNGRLRHLEPVTAQ